MVEEGLIYTIREKRISHANVMEEKIWFRHGCLTPAATLKGDSVSDVSFRNGACA